MAKIFSSMVFADKAEGRIKVFTSCLGLPVPMLGEGPYPKWNPGVVLNDDLTNLTKPGELGPSIGDAVIRRIEAEYLSGAEEDIAEIKKHVVASLSAEARQITFPTPLSALPLTLEPFALVAGADCFHLLLEVPRPLHLRAPVMVRFSLDAFITSKDVKGRASRLKHVCQLCDGSGYVAAAKEN